MDRAGPHVIVELGDKRIKIMNDETFWIDPKLQKSEVRPNAGDPQPLAQEAFADPISEEDIFSSLSPICLDAVMEHLARHPGNLLPQWSTMKRFEFISYIALVELDSKRHILHAIWRAGFEGALAAGVTAYPYNKERIWPAGTQLISPIAPP